MNRPLTPGTERRAEPMSAVDERLSALVDGELPASEWAACWADEEGAHLEVVGRYAWIGEVLRHGETAPPPADLQRVAGIMARLREDAPQGVLPLQAASPIVVAPARAANDEVFRWKLLAGFAVLAAAVSVIWNVSQHDASGVAGPQLAQATQASPDQPSPAEQTLAQADAGSSAVVVQGRSGPMLRDPRLEELMAAHRQAGGLSALQMPAGFLRNATFEIPGEDR